MQRINEQADNGGQTEAAEEREMRQWHSQGGGNDMKSLSNLKLFISHQPLLGLLK